MQKFTGFKGKQPNHPVTIKDGKKYKVCNICEINKPVEEFSKRSYIFYIGICKDCTYKKTSKLTAKVGS